MSERTTAAVDRRAFVKQLLTACPDALVVTGLGSASYDVFAAGDGRRIFICGVPWVVLPRSLGIALRTNKP